MSNEDLGWQLYYLLNQHDQNIAAQWRSLFLERHPAWTTGPLPSTEGQVREINYFWRTQIGLLEDNTLDVRRYLVDGINSEQWLRLFVNYVLRTVLDYRLPNYHINLEGS